MFIHLVKMYIVGVYLFTERHLPCLLFGRNRPTQRSIFVQIESHRSCLFAFSLSLIFSFFPFSLSCTSPSSIFLHFHSPSLSHFLLFHSNFTHLFIRSLFLLHSFCFYTPLSRVLFIFFFILYHLINLYTFFLYLLTLHHSLFHYLSFHTYLIHVFSRFLSSS